MCCPWICCPKVCEGWGWDALEHVVFLVDALELLFGYPPPVRESSRIYGKWQGGTYPSLPYNSPDTPGNRGY